MALNGVITLILHYFTEFDSFASQQWLNGLKINLLCTQNIVSQLHLAKIDRHSSRMLSL